MTKDNKNMPNMTNNVDPVFHPKSVTDDIEKARAERKEQARAQAYTNSVVGPVPAILRPSRAEQKALRDARVNKRLGIGEEGTTEEPVEAPTTRP